jgi:hypothetical protein
MDSVVYVEEFVLWQSARGKAEGTIRTYRKALAEFGEWLSQQSGTTAEGITPQDLARYVNALREQYPPDQVNISVSALRGYFRWLMEEELRVDGQNPARRLKFLPALREEGRLAGGRHSTVRRYTYMNDAVAAEVHARTSPLARLHKAAGSTGMRRRRVVSSFLAARAATAVCTDSHR